MLAVSCHHQLECPRGPLKARSVLQMTLQHTKIYFCLRSVSKSMQPVFSDGSHAINVCNTLLVYCYNLYIPFVVFLLQLLVVIAFLLSEVLLPPSSSLLAIPYKFILQRLLPDIYTSETEITLHPYVASGLLFVNVTTLVLFFASGMYSEKIAYANK